MKRQLLFLFVFLYSAISYSQISFQGNEITSFSGGIGKRGDINNDGDIDFISVSYNSIDWFENKYPENGFKPKKAIVTMASHYIQSIDLSDFDGDGDLDILVADMASDKLYWHENLGGEGNFGPMQLLKTIDLVHFVKHIDMDNDGDKDLLYINGNGNVAYNIGYYENTNLATNYTLFHLVTNQYFTSSHTAHFNDLDGDGDVDVFLKYEQSLGWIRNNGNGTFSNVNAIVSPSNYQRVCAINDIDNDGDADMVGYVENNIGVKKLIYHLNDGLGNFGAEQIIRLNSTDIYAIKLDDLDGDTKVDIAVSIKNSNPQYYSDLLWYKNDGQYNFATQPTIDVKIMHLNAIETFNPDNDGDKEIITANGQRISIYKNNGLGGFSIAEYPAAPSQEASCAIAGDIDNDGDLDVVNSSFKEGKIFLYKKSNTDATYGSQLIVSHVATGAKAVAIADMDGDSDMDIISISGLSTSGSDDKVSWYKNLDGQGNFGPQINLPIGGYDSPDGLRVYDVDNDGDKDIVTSLTNWPATGDKIIWFSNNGSGSFASAQIIATGVNGVKFLLESDMDNDGDLDLVSASSIDNKVAWFENLNGHGNFGAQRIITTAALYVTGVSVADMDHDGDKDVVYMSNGNDDNILWQKNLDGLGNFGLPVIINSNVDGNGSGTISTGDFDGDTDIDVVVGEYSKTTWLENLYGQGNFDPPKTISINEFGDASSSQVVDLDQDGDLDVLMTLKGENKIVWHKNLGVTRNVIKGVVRLDLEGNGCGANDLLLPGVLVSTTNGSTTEAAVTFSNEHAGEYQLFTGQGNYQTSVISNLPTYFTLTPLTQNSSFTGFGTTDTVNFCVEPIGQINDLKVAMYPLRVARPGFSTSYQLVYRNIGTTTLTGQVTVQYNDSKIQFLNGSTVPSSQTVNTLSFDFVNLKPFEIRAITLNFNVFSPPTTNIGNPLVFTATVNPVSSDYTQEDNTFVLNQTVIGSFDPNDITCLEGDEVLISDADEYLHYVVRFQNTGTASAINVKVAHLLDPKLDWTTFQLESLSHDGRVTIKNRNLVEFAFNDIDLPDSTSDEVHSHGFATFKIKPKTSTLVVGDVVNATANIYFDNNPPVTTNTSSTEYVSQLGADSFDYGSFMVYPNPAKDQLVISAKEEILEVEVYTILGSKILEEKNKSTINVSDLKSGVYLLSITTESGKCTKKFIKQ